MGYVPGYRHDIYVSYSRSDNEATPLDPRWVDAFVYSFRMTLGQQIGNTAGKLSIFFDERSLSNAATLADTIDQITQSALFLAICSPNYLAHDWCRNEIETFVSEANGTAPLLVAELLPLEDDAYPEALRSIPHHKFWERSEEGIPKTIQLRGETREFVVRIANLADDARRLLTSLVATPRKRPNEPRRGAGVTVQAKPGEAGHVFVSFSRHDKPTAMTIVEHLERQGLPCWISSRDVPHGSDFQDAIVEALESASAMVLVFSRSANNSNEIKKELAIASEHELLVLPVRIEDVEPAKGFRYQLATRQYIDLFEDRDQSMDLIVRALRRHVPTQK